MIGLVCLGLTVWLGWLLSVVLVCMACFNCVDVFVDAVSLWCCLWFLVLFCLID